MARLHGLRVGREPMSVQAVRNICVHPFLSACICVSPFLAGCRAARTEWRLAGGARFVVFESSWWTCWAASPVRPTGAHCRTRRAAPTGEPLSGGHGPYAEGVVEARNPIFVQRPYEPGGGPAGPGGPGWSGRGPEAPGRPGPGQTTRLVVVAGRRTRFSRVDAMQRGAGQQRRVGRVRARRRGWWLWRGTECDFRASMPCNVERASSAGLPGSGPDGTAGGCGGARNAIFARRCHATWSGPAALAWPGSGRKGTAAKCAGARNAIFARRCHATWSGPAAPGWPGSDRTARLAGAGGARNSISARRCHATWSGPEAPGWSGPDPDGTAGGCGGARNAIFARRCHATWSGPAAPGRPGPDRMARLAGAGGARNAIFVQRPYEPGTGSDGRSARQFHSCVDQEADPGASVVSLRQDGTLGQGAGSTEREHHEIPSLPPGACPGGGTVRVDGQQFSFRAIWLPHRHGRPRTGFGDGHPSRHRAVGMAGTSPAMTLRGRTARPK